MPREDYACNGLEVYKTASVFSLPHNYISTYTLTCSYILVGA
jgi:hypothetical protein